MPTWGYWTIGTFVLGSALLIFIGTGGPGKLMESSIPYLESALRGAVLGFLALLYFLPTAVGRKSPRVAAIFLANLFFGWTIIGWIISLIWATAEAGSRSAK